MTREFRAPDKGRLVSGEEIFSQGLLFLPCLRLPLLPATPSFTMHGLSSSSSTSHCTTSPGYFHRESFVIRPTPLYTTAYEIVRMAEGHANETTVSFRINLELWLVRTQRENGLSIFLPGINSSSTELLLPAYPFSRYPILRSIEKFLRAELSRFAIIPPISVIRCIGRRTPVNWHPTPGRFVSSFSWAIEA